MTQLPRYYRIIVYLQRQTIKNRTNEFGTVIDNLTVNEVKKKKDWERGIFFFSHWICFVGETNRLGVFRLKVRYCSLAWLTEFRNALGENEEAMVYIVWMVNIENFVYRDLLMLATTCWFYDGLFYVPSKQTIIQKLGNSRKFFFFFMRQYLLNVESGFETASFSKIYLWIIQNFVQRQTLQMVSMKKVPIWNRLQKVY